MKKKEEVGLVAKFVVQTCRQLKCYLILLQFRYTRVKINEIRRGLIQTKPVHITECMDRPHQSRERDVTGL